MPPAYVGLFCFQPAAAGAVRNKNGKLKVFQAVPKELGLQVRKLKGAEP